jgi:transcriptional antiterminator NusG
MSDINEMNVGVRWYVAHTYSGYENKVKASLEKIVENRGLGHLIFDIKIPVETIVEQNGEEVKEKESKLFPCYVLVKMIMTEESWHAVRNITGVTGFIGPGSRPTPLSEAEVEALNIDTKRVELSFKSGDEVTVIDGIFAGYAGTVQSISDDMNFTGSISYTTASATPTQTNYDGMKLVVHDYIDLGDTRLKEIVSEYTIQQIGNETRALRVSQGGVYGI